MEDREKGTDVPIYRNILCTERKRWKTEMVKRDLKVVEILDIDKAAKSEARHIEGCK